MPKRGSTGEGELRRRFEPVSDELVLAAIDRAERHRRGVEREWAMLSELTEHLGFVRTGWTTRQLRPQLGALAADGLLAAHRRHSREVWELTKKGRQRLEPSASIGRTLRKAAKPVRTGELMVQFALHPRLAGAIVSFESRGINDGDSLLLSTPTSSAGSVYGSPRQKARAWFTLARHRLRGVSTFVLRVIAPRSTFALDMTDEEREIMGRHAAHWQPFIDSGQMVIFGPVLDTTGSWGLGVVEAEDEDELRTFVASDPVITTGTADIEIGKMLAGFVRPR